MGGEDPYPFWWLWGRPFGPRKCAIPGLGGTGFLLISQLAPISSDVPPITKALLSDIFQFGLIWGRPGIVDFGGLGGPGDPPEAAQTPNIDDLRPAET